MTAWSARSSWGAWSTWGAGEPGVVVWGDLNTWGQLGVWFDPDGFPEMPSLADITAYAGVSAGEVAPLVVAGSVLRPLVSVHSSMRPLGSDGASMGPASVAASGMTVAAPELAPGVRIVEVTSAEQTVSGVSVTIQHAADLPLVGIPVFYGAETPDHAGPYLWVRAADDIIFEDGV